METNYGYLTVRTYTANRAIPISDVNIEIYGSDDEVSQVKFFTTTDADGVSDRVKLPAPSSVYSMAPHPNEKPYSSYNIKVYKDGYYAKNIEGVPIFSGIEADLPVNMIALNAGDSYPRGNINAVITENEFLEA